MGIKDKNITYCCQDCGNKIGWMTAIYRGGRCRSCSMSGKLNRNFGKHLSKETRRKLSKLNTGKNHPFFGKKHSKESRLKMSEAQMGNKKGYIHGLSVSPYPSVFNNKFKSKIRCRDNHICQNCGITEEEHVKRFQHLLSVHHIDYNKFNNNKKNLITLCVTCHAKTNGNRDYWFAYCTYLMENR